MNRRSKSTFDRPTCKASRPQRHIVNSEYSGPVFLASRYAIESDKHVISLVASLFVTRGPAAVLFGVSGIVVFTLDGVVGRGAWPHVLIKRRKRVSPLVAHGNASFSVSLIARSVWVVASLAYFLPDFIFWQKPKSMRAMGVAVSLAVKATAALRFSAAQVTAYYSAIRSALAFTQPYRFAMPVVSCVAQYRQSPEHLSRQVLEIGASFDRISFSHDASPVSRLVRDAAGTTNPVAFRHLYTNYLAM